MMEVHEGIISDAPDAIVTQGSNENEYLYQGVEKAQLGEAR